MVRHPRGAAFSLSTFPRQPAPRAPHGAAQPLLGTDPVGWHCRAARGSPLALDMAFPYRSARQDPLRRAERHADPRDLGAGRARRAHDRRRRRARRRHAPSHADGRKGVGACDLHRASLCRAHGQLARFGGTGLLRSLAPGGTGHIFGCVDIQRFLPLETFEVCARRAFRASLSHPAQPGGDLLPRRGRRSAAPPRARRTAFR